MATLEVTLEWGVRPGPGSSLRHRGLEGGDVQLGGSPTSSQGTGPGTMPLSHLGSSRRSSKGLRKDSLGPAKGQLVGVIFGVWELRFETRACAKLGNPGLGMLKAGTVQGLPDRYGGMQASDSDCTPKQYTGTLGSGPLLMRLPATSLLTDTTMSESQRTRDLFLMQIWSTLLQRSSSQSSLALEGEQGQVGEARRTRVAAGRRVP